MARTTRRRRTTLTRDDGLAGAMELGVRVLTVARRMGVSRGSLRLI